MSKEKMKGFIIGIITMTLFFSMSLSAYALIGTKSLTANYNNIKIYVNQKLITPKDADGNIVEPFMCNGTTYLPVRAISEALGQEVSWNGDTKSVYIGQQQAVVSEVPKSLEGYWKRSDSNSNFDGLVLNVKAVNRGYIGIIAELPAGMSSLGYHVGDTKWDGVELLSEGLYKLNDLGKNKNGYEDTYWFEMRLEFDKKNSDTITLYDVESSGEDGSYQVYHRIKQ